MTERIHDTELDTSEVVVRVLVEAQCPQWAMCSLLYLRTSGTDNAMWRVRLDGEPDVVVRLPRTTAAAASVAQEVRVLRHVESARIGSMVATPTLRHVGEPHEVFPHDWCVLEWIDGSDAWAARDELAGNNAFVQDLGEAVLAVGELVVPGVSVRRPGTRGGPLDSLLERLDRWLSDPQWNAASLIDVDAVRRLGAQARELINEPAPEGFVHGDLIPGNLLVDRGRLAAVIDWGGSGRGDTAQDLAPAWAVLSADQRSVFRDVVGVDDAAWIRARTFELEHAVGGVLYYVPRGHLLGDVMSRTLTRILDSP